MHLDKSISDKIKYLCRAINEVEWSGVLFYSVAGTVAQPKDMSITLMEIYPMHKGTTAHTDYSYDEDLVGFRMDRMEVNHWNIGHIHSHNNMGVFFSAEDTSELNDNIDNHNYYLSVVVNNKFDVTARLAFKAVRQGIGITGMDENGDPYTLQSSEKEEIIYYYECEIEKDDPVYIVDKMFADRTEQIIKKASERKPVVAALPYSTQPGATKPVTGFAKPAVNKNWENWNDSIGMMTQKDWDKKHNGSEAVLFDPEDDDAEQEAMEMVDQKMEEMLIDLLTSWPNLSLTEDDANNMVCLEDAFIFLQKKVGSRTRPMFLNYVMDNLQVAFDKYFPVMNDLNDINYEQGLTIMIQFVEEFRDQFITAGHLCAKLNRKLLEFTN